MGPFFDLMQGFASAMTPTHLAMCFAGVLLGQMVGVLPGIGPSAAIALLLPFTYGASPTAAIIMFAGIYYGAQYGGTLTSVLVSVPGESSTVMTSIDGYQMALQGRAGTALGAVGSSILKGLATGVAGLLFGTIGIDPQTGVSRFDFGQVWLLDGIEFIVLTVALFGVGEVLASCTAGTVRPILHLNNVLPTRADWRASRLPILRGSGIGFLIGVLP